jgi:hypothetical protein
MQREGKELKGLGYRTVHRSRNTITPVPFHERENERDEGKKE